MFTLLVLEKVTYTLHVPTAAEQEYTLLVNTWLLLV
jgi:hypothetical protein